MIMLITGGIKSGKSSRALRIAREEWPFPIHFIATAQVTDEELGLRIRRHQEERARLGGDAGFVTIEEPLELGEALSRAGPYAVVDCIPMWINNLIYHKREADFSGILGAVIRGLRQNRIVVTNETGMGNVPFDETTRRYNELLAEANRKIAEAADRVELMVSGIPLRIK
ncbi:bifunctional adenosylcobinamide kinase/adenosylcobinamide-phosphate guanylyltransferase [Treponema sp. TIM-1]|uniref:bifunctional adenosylcobinamide kinase/adenosylcobinamide-phosphate guanylyltransferase n=1 Tax=Treponema sp. TIM-1 TaxID=2898417 RepID=UPI0039801DB9